MFKFWLTKKLVDVIIEIIPFIIILALIFIVAVACIIREKINKK